LAACRMYRSNGEVWRGLGKNATEGLAAPTTIGPMTVFLLGGQVLPFVLLGFGSALSSTAGVLVLGAVGCALLPRLLAVGLFKQPFGAALLHPAAILVLLAVQWLALVRWLTGKPSMWKGRAYVVTSPQASGVTMLSLLFCLLSGHPLLAGTTTLPSSSQPRSCPAQISAFELTDQFNHTHRFTLPRTQVTLLTIADKKGSEQVGDWIRAFKSQYAQRIAYLGVADLGKVPGMFRGLVEKSFRKQQRYPVLLDWKGTLAKSLACKPDEVTVLVLDRNGSIQARVSGSINQDARRELGVVIDRLLSNTSAHEDPDHGRNRFGGHRAGANP